MINLFFFAEKSLIVIKKRKKLAINSGSERKIIRDDSLHVSEEGYDG